jgi:hypothetical protein
MTIYQKQTTPAVSLLFGLSVKVFNPLRVPHGYSFTRGFQATGHPVTVTVPDFNTLRETVPVTTVSWYCIYTPLGS